MANYCHLSYEDGLNENKSINQISKELISNNRGKRIAIVCHNACILFYLLKYCKLESAVVKKKLTISYNDKILIKENIMASPSIMKLQFDSDRLISISYLESI